MHFNGLIPADKLTLCATPSLDDLTFCLPTFSSSK